MTKQEIINHGYGLSMGMEAAKINAPRVPAKDEKFMEYVKENCKEFGSSISVSKGWLEGYEFQMNQQNKTKERLVK